VRHEQNSGNGSDDRRREQLLVAAQAVRSWVREQRDGWSKPSGARVVAPELPRTAAAEPPSIQAITPPVQPIPVPVAIAPEVAPRPLSPEPVDAGQAERFPKERAVAAAAAGGVARGVADSVRTIGGPLVRWTIRLAVAALLVVGLAAGAWKARDYWQQRTTTADQSAAPPAGGSASNLPSSGAPVRTGRLQVESEPSGAKVFVDGRNRGVTPLTIESLPVGTHVVVVDSSKGTVRRSVAITANETARISETIYTGWLAVASPFELSISEGGQSLRADERDQYVLSPGSHELQLENRTLGYHDTRKVDIRPGEVTRISVTPAASTITVNATVPATVAIDGERIGETPISAHPINLGTRDVVVTAASGGEKRFTITVTAAPVKLDVDFNK
jgi:hypothetical protein